eukprot:TRINITY_DN983_c0_g1_i1.p1 TRINITY_DN983_c0_g1~~TRINITY_DN983_c0_g1_i1.p1  ORF type:complete len:228 (-),score=48.58 TRINITY_DN983_c0_g1_i1:66-749(-)
MMRAGGPLFISELAEPGSDMQSFRLVCNAMAPLVLLSYVKNDPIVFEDVSIFMLETYGIHVSVETLAAMVDAAFSHLKDTLHNTIYGEVLRYDFPSSAAAREPSAVASSSSSYPSSSSSSSSAQTAPTGAMTVEPASATEVLQVDDSIILEEEDEISVMASDSAPATAAEPPAVQASVDDDDEAVKVQTQLLVDIQNLPTLDEESAFNSDVIQAVRDAIYKGYYIVN